MPCRFCFLLGVLWLVFCSGAASAASDTAQAKPPLPQSMFGGETVAILSSATRVETFQIDGDFEPSDSLLERRQYARLKDGLTAYREIDHYPITAIGPVENQSFASKLAQGIHDLSGIYGLAGCFSPGIAFRAWRGRECVEMIICFTCGHRIVTTRDAQGRIIHQEDVPNSPELLPLALQAFPQNKELQVLAALRSAPPSTPHPYVPPPEADEKLIEAVAHGDSTTFQYRLNAISEEDVRTLTGPLALVMAIRRQRSEMIHQLLDRGVPAEGTGVMRASPLMLAAALGDADTVQLLLARGAGVNIRTQEGETAIMAAARRGNTDIMRLLISKGASLADADKNGKSLLMLAAQSGQMETVNFLLSQGMNINNRDKDGETALSLVAEAGHADAVQQLLDRGATLDASDAHGETALMKAAERVQTEAVSCLLQHGADIRTRDRDGMTPLMQAVMQVVASDGQTDCVRLLISHGADVNARDTDGDTALVLAAPYGEQAAPLVRLLLAHGANIQARTKDSETALLLSFRSAPLIQILLTGGAAVDAADADGDTPLMWAADNNALPSVQLLLRHGANVHHRDRYGDTAVSLAQKDKCGKVLPTLIQAARRPQRRS